MIAVSLNTDEKLEHGAEVPSEKVLSLAKEDKQLGMETNPDEHSTETEVSDTIGFS